MLAEKRHNPAPPRDTQELRRKFLKETEQISKMMNELRLRKMDVYGMNWMKRGWDSLFQNLDRKFGIIEENMWRKLIQQRVELTPGEFIALADGLIDLANYAIFGRWLLQELYPEMYRKLLSKIREATEVELSNKQEGEHHDAE